MRILNLFSLDLKKILIGAIIAFIIWWFTSRKNMETSYFEQLKKWLTFEEGVVKIPIQDGGKMSVGIGHNVQKGEEYLLNAVLTDDLISKLFKTDTDFFISELKKRLPAFSTYTSNEKVALVSLVFNCGMGNFDITRLYRYLKEFGTKFKQKDRDTIIDMFKSSTGASPALNQRRIREANLFLS